MRRNFGSGDRRMLVSSWVAGGGGNITGYSLVRPLPLRCRCRGVEPSNLVPEELPYSAATHSEPAGRRTGFRATDRDGNASRGSPIQFHRRDPNDSQPKQVILLAAKLRRRARTIIDEIGSE